MTRPISLKPHLSEKGYRQSEELNTYIFVVPAGVNADQVAQSVAQHYDVNVISVRLASRPAKPLRVYRKRGRYLKAKHQSLNKAYVTLKEGSKLPFFAEVEKTEAEMKKSDRKVL